LGKSPLHQFVTSRCHKVNTQDAHGGTRVLQRRVKRKVSLVSFGQSSLRSGRFIGSYFPSDGDGDPEIEIEMRFVVDTEDGSYEADIYNLSDPDAAPRLVVGRIQESDCLRAAVAAIREWRDREPVRIAVPLLAMAFSAAVAPFIGA
jgi:hypothetical protein